MKNILPLAILLLFSAGLFAQAGQVTATIDRNCNSIPAKLNIPSGKTAVNFSMETLNAGNNCYNGSKFEDRGFVIKNSNGDIVFKYTINKKGETYEPNGSLSSFNLGAGIYYIHVDGGNGARLDLKYNLK